MATFVDPRDHRRTDTRQRIVDAAQQLIGAQGFRRTTIADIERAVGLRPGGGGLYRHFASKGEVLEEVVAQYAGRVRDLRARRVEQRRIGQSAEADLAGDLVAVAVVFESFLANEAAVVRLKDDMATMTPAAREGISDAWDEGYLVVADLFEEHGIPPERARLLAVHALGDLDHFATHVAAWGRAPLGIDGLVFVRHWADTWSAVALDDRH